MSQVPNESNRPSSLLLAALLVVASLLLARSIWQFASRSLFPVNWEPRVVTPRGDLADDEKSTIELFKAAAPSVVFIATTQVKSNQLTRNLQEIPQGSGTGFLWDNQGHVVTNVHVLSNASRAYVRLSDGSELEASVVGAAPDKDIAVLRVSIDSAKIRPLPLGSSSDLQVGQKVFAIGNPFGLDQTLTTGIISGLERQIQSMTGRAITGVIQTDAAINPGNSGGPLLDSAGRIIGVNTAIVSPSGANAGVGFAVPIDVVNRVAPEIIAKGQYVRPGLGVEIAPKSLADRWGVRRGALVLYVGEGSAAEAAGLRPTRQVGGRLMLGDVIIAVNETEIANRDDLSNTFEKYKVGEQVKLTVERDGEPIELTATLQAL